MLNKLMKQEIKASARFLLPTYLVLIVISILNRLILNMNLNHGILLVIPSILLFTYVVSIITVLVISFTLMIFRFYKNYLTDEGYLMFTLPVTTRDLVFSKLIVTFGYTLATFLAALLSAFIAFATTERMQVVRRAILDFFHEIASYNANTKMAIFISIIFVCVVLIENILCIYTSIALGQLYTKHKLLGSFIAYMLIYTILQIIGLILVGIAYLLQLNFTFDHSAIFYMTSIAIIIYDIILSIVFYHITSHIFRNRLNLD